MKTLRVYYLAVKYWFQGEDWYTVKAFAKYITHWKGDLSA